MVPENLWGAAGAPLFTIGGATVTLAGLVSAALVLAASIWLSRGLQRVAAAALRRGGIESEGTVGRVAALLNYFVLLVGLGIALKAVGIDLGTLFAAGALFAVGLGFAMQNIAQNFVAGIILLGERAIRPGDVIAVEGMIVRVARMGIRATIVRSRDGEELIVPNSLLVQNPVKNYTLNDNTCRIRAVVGVTYASDLALVRRTLEEVGQSLAERLEEPEPQVLLLEFGSSAVNYELAVWIPDAWEARRALSRVYEAIWLAFKEKHIAIAFPQLDLHVDAPLLAALRRDAA